MAIAYGSYSANWKPKGADEYRRYRAFLVYSTSETDTTFTISAYMGVNLNYSVTKSGYSAQLRIGGNTWTATGSTTYGGAKTVTFIATHSVTYQKQTSAYTVNVYGDVKCTTNTGTGGWTGAWSTAGVTITIPAIRYAISYDANGGTNAPATQKKVHGTDLTLTTDVPVRASYDFTEWNTAADGSGTAYASGGTFSTNAITTLYAQWHESFQEPSVANLRAYRVDSTATGANPDVKSDGTMCYVDFEYTAPVSGGTPTITAQFGSSTAVAMSASGSTRYAYSSAGHLPATSSEIVTVTIAGTDYRGNAYSYSYSTFISTENYVWDAYKGTSGSEEYESFAIGGMARDFDSSARSSNGNFDCYMDVAFHTMAGEIKMWGGATIPNGWLLCDGSEVSKTTYPKLYAAIGDLWGTPSSNSNFVLPNFSGKVPAGFDSTDTDFDTVGETGGAKERQLSATIGACNDSITSLGYIKDGVTTYQNSHNADYVVTGSNISFSKWNHSTPVVEATSSSRNVSMLQPYAVVKYIICAI